MREYQFQYTKTKGGLIVLLACFIGMAIIIGIGVHFKLQKNILIYIITPVAVVAIFKLLKKNTFGNCIAQLSDTKVEFNFDEQLRTINFDDILSFKTYYGNNATVLYLKDNTYNFKLYANNFCDRKSFDVFCKDIIIQLDKYKSADHPNIIHEGSVFATKGMLYFLSIATLIYLLAFFVETKEASLYVGIGGGFYLLVMWFAYFNKRNSKSK
jgi:hypothetical protein